MEDGYASGASCECYDSSSADEEKTLKKRKTSASIKKWNERNMTLLIDLLEERPYEPNLEENSKRQKRQEKKWTIQRRSVQVPLGLIGIGAVSRSTIEVGKHRRYDCTSR